VPKYSYRILIALLYIYLPNTAEVHANITNAHWFLAIASFMIIISQSPQTVLGKIFDNVFIILASLSGPFAIFLLPSYTIRLIYLKKNNNKDYKYFLYLFIPYTICVLVQLLSLYFTSYTRVDTSLGASLMSFVQIISGQVYIASLIGAKGYSYVYNHIFSQGGFVAPLLYSVVFLGGTGIVLYSVVYSKLELKLFWLFTSIILFFSLYKPMGSVVGQQWQIMAMPGAATRYWAIPMLAFILSLLFLIKSWYNMKILRIFPIAILLLFSLGLVLESIQTPWPDLQYKQQTQQFETVPVGQTYHFNILPQGWKMQLIKK